MNREECAERIQLIDEYSRSIAAYTVHLDLWKHQTPAAADWQSVQAAQAESEKAWIALERHIAEHRCLDWFEGPSTHSMETASILAEAAEAALDVILVVDNDRRYVDVNEAAAELLGLPRSEVIGRRIEEFFIQAKGIAIPEAWARFISEGTQSGICELIAPGRPRRFEYRAKADFAPGLHLSILRELPDLE
ncbi:MAG TPA: PAS domain-containing protein [Bryobacteraceae bacterium]